MDDQMDDQLSAAARDYHEPPATPREEMWAVIQAGRRAGGQADGADAERARRSHIDRRILAVRPSAHPPVRRSSFRPVRPAAWAAGIAAILALGIGLGRWTAEPAPERPLAMSTEAPRANATAYHLATTEHLGQSETFLTLFRTSVRGKTNERLASATARQLLATNRLLLDSPASRDARLRLLLQDLELVLAQIAQLSPSPKPRDLDLITEGLEEGGVLSRLRTAVPAGTSVTQGAL